MAKLQIFAEGDGDGGVHANGDGVENGKSGDKIIRYLLMIF